MIRYLIALASPLSWLAAQNAPPVFVPKATPVVRMRCAGMGELRARWPATAIGRLFAEPDLEDLVATTSTWLRSQEERRHDIYQAAVDLQVDLDPIDIRNLCNGVNPLGALLASFSQVRRFEFFVTLATSDEGRVRTDTATVVSCLPQYEGKWTRLFEDLAQTHRRSPWFDEQETAKVDGYSAYRFTPKRGVDPDQRPPPAGIGKWLLHLPGTFIYGSGAPEQLGSVEMAPKQEMTGLQVDVSIPDYMRPFTNGAPVADGFGLGLLQRLQVRAFFDGDQIVDEIDLSLTPGKDRAGLVGALLSGTGKLAPQALPKGAIAQIRCSVAYDKLYESVVDLIKNEFNGEIPLPNDVMADLGKVLDGSLSFGVCAPAPGGLIPRLYATLGLADTDAFDRISKWAVDAGMPTKTSKLSGHECTSLKLPDMPQGIMPAFVRVGDKLHIAESGRSLRTFLKAQKDGADAMDVGELEPVAGQGELVEGFEARFDMAQLYRSYYVNWLPLLELAAGGSMAISRDDMPDPDLVDEHVGKLFGTVRRDGDHYVLRHRGPVGGPILGAYMMMWGTIVSEAANDRTASVMKNAIAAHRLKMVGKALETFEQREDRLPKDLAELMDAEKLPDDALLVPEDELTEEFTLPSGKKLRSSFRYFPEGVAAQCMPGENAIMIEIAPRAFSRQFLGRSGTVKRCYFSESKTPIDSFGK